ncbi:unnamed protein product [Strongylus vulgaris]|uniref:Uncharacterized protein n=1 Tax=Strongylus vulgaris TaxID=40348 RepID=A0A3P7KKZ3_STRVU|nr:unnamed protein product [Strongylus vulgaris]
MCRVSTSASEAPATSVFPHFLFPGTAFPSPSTVSEISSPMIMQNSIDISPAQIQQAYLSFLVGQQLNSAAAAAAASNPLRILAQDQGWFKSFEGFYD